MRVHHLNNVNKALQILEQNNVSHLQLMDIIIIVDYKQFNQNFILFRFQFLLKLFIVSIR